VAVPADVEVREPFAVGLGHNERLPSAEHGQTKLPVAPGARAQSNGLIIDDRPPAAPARGAVTAPTQASAEVLRALASISIVGPAIVSNSLSASRVPEQMRSR